MNFYDIFKGRLWSSPHERRQTRHRDLLDGVEPHGRVRDDRPARQEAADHRDQGGNTHRYISIWAHARV